MPKYQPFDKRKQVVTGSDGGGFHETVQARDYVRAQQQNANRQAAEVAMLSGENLSFAQWRDLRNNARLLLDPNKPMDEMDMESYKLARQHGTPTSPVDENDGFGGALVIDRRDERKRRR
jgi:hypothetical protein